METEPAYVMGHSPRELERLTRQAKVIDPITRQGFLNAGIAPGMRVLDIGSGVGDVALLAASVVGPTGSVTGTDRSAVALEVARSRTKDLPHVNFLLGDPSELDFTEEFDAAVGRYVLMFQPDPAAFLKGVARHLREGGIVAFHEPDWAGATSFPACPTYDACCQWLVELLIRSNCRGRMGVELTETFIDAGLPAPKMHVGKLIGGAEEAIDPAQLVAELTVSLLPEIERYGVATASEVGPDDLFARIMQEAIFNRATLVCRSEIVAWAKV